MLLPPLYEGADQLKLICVVVAPVFVSAVGVSGVEVGTVTETVLEAAEGAL